jgi:mono/diheme cytochrome c family protein
MRRQRAEPRRTRQGFAVLLVAGLVVMGASGCHQGMWNNSRLKPLEKGPFFQNGMSAQPFVEGTVAFEQPETDELFYTGKINGQFSPVFPFEITKDVLKRGQDRFNIFCSPCHSRVGDGNGMIVQRELKRAGNYHQQRLVDSPPGYFFDVMTNGFGVMYSYASRIKPEDRWAIAAYIRVLQLSQNASLADVPPEEREKLLNPQPGPEASESHGPTQGAH